MKLIQGLFCAQKCCFQFWCKAQIENYEISSGSKQNSEEINENLKAKMIFYSCEHDDTLLNKSKHFVRFK